MSQKPSIPRGTRDFSPVEMLRRNYIFDTIRRIFSLYGYLPLETPAMENLQTLLGKYGEEGDRLLFRILNSGDFLSGVERNELLDADPSLLSSKLCEKGLRYDLTVPFARYVVQHRDEITFPFRRYQIQPVWRADRPQKGRYREFYQCDVDVIGSDSLLNEYELVEIIDRVFTELGVRVVVRVNNRKILAGIAEVIGEKERITDITVAIDKLDKIGKEAVNEELLSKGISMDAVKRLDPVISLEGSPESKLDELEKILSSSETGISGVKEARELFSMIAAGNRNCDVVLDLSLARGLNYYTGAIIEVKASDVEIGSICGGGRYDNLTGIFGLPGVSGVGVSFGADRIYDVMNNLALFPQQSGSATEALIINFGRDGLDDLLMIGSSLRREGIRTEIYPDPVKLKKQFAYADSCGIPLVIIAGSEELKSGLATVKEMKTGVQTSVPVPELPGYIKSLPVI